jgi:hypothetical protein
VILDVMKNASNQRMLSKAIGVLNLQAKVTSRANWRSAASAR